MAQITINEISQNYTYNIGTSAYCTVALPITASWGPGYFDPASQGKDVETVLENTVWERFAANQAGLESFVSTYRGPAANYRLAKDFSYQMAMTLLTAGYDVLVCRLCPGVQASATTGKITFKAKYPGTFGNYLQVALKKVANRDYYNLVVYVKDATGVKNAVENITFTFDLESSNDNILHVSEIESDFIIFEIDGEITKEEDASTIEDVELKGGSDRAADKSAQEMMDEAIVLAKARFMSVGHDESGFMDYVGALTQVRDTTDKVSASTFRYREWLYTHLVRAVDASALVADGLHLVDGDAVATHLLDGSGNHLVAPVEGGTTVDLSTTVDGVYDLLKDKLAYNPNRIISPGWDDQNILSITPDADVRKLNAISPIHIKLMEVAYYSRCATAYLDVPKSLPRKAVHDVEDTGYAQLLARHGESTSVVGNVNTALYVTHSALFAPWGQYTYVGTGRHNVASPAFLALMIQRAMILNQSIQYEWALPTNRKHNLNIGELDYKTPKKVLDKWQDAKEGVGVNVITQVPDLGTCLWGNSTLYELPPATYQALANLSTRLLFNAIEDVAYRVGVSITYQYNNDEAYSRFYAGVTPILDTMKNVGAIEGYKVKMSADINGLDQVNANTVIGKIYLIINGVINDIAIDLVALPPGSDLSVM